MSERPILFSGATVQAIIAGRKTQTRRVVKEQYFGCLTGDCPHDTQLECDTAIADWIMNDGPYGYIGDRLIVKETHYLWGKWEYNGLTKTGKPAQKFKQIPWRGEGNGIRFDVAETHPFEKELIFRTRIGWHKRPSIFMPLRAGRITLEITGVRVERLKEISYKDCVAEGCKDDGFANDRFWHLWDSINGKKHPWKSNPWLWVIEFKKL